MKRFVAIVILAWAFLHASTISAGEPGTITRMSVSQAGQEGNDFSCCPSISPDGRYVAFISYATNLVPGDTNGTGDVFLRDTLAGTIERVSIAHDEAQGNGDSAEDAPSVSADGRYVAFTSTASNLVPGDTNTLCYYDDDDIADNCADVFVRDRVAGWTDRVSVDTNEGQVNGSSFQPDISADGRYVAFSSYATNLVDQDTQICTDFGFAYNCADIFVRERFIGLTVSRTAPASNGDSYRPSIDAIGRFLAFESYSTGGEWGVRPYACDRNRDGLASERCPTVQLFENPGGIKPILGPNFGAYEPSISANGAFVVYASDASNIVGGDTNGRRDVFLQDIATLDRFLVSVSSEEQQGNADSGGCCFGSSVSDDGRFVAFHSKASNLVPSDTQQCMHLVLENCYDTFIRDRLLGKTVRISLAPNGTHGNSDSSSPQITPNGRYVAFDGSASNLVPGDTNQCPGPCFDAFRQDFGDEDGDGAPDPFDNCPAFASSNFTDADSDDVGDVCDNCPVNPNPSQANSDDDPPGDECDDNDDNDLWFDNNDNCVRVANDDQLETDGDMAGEACDVPGSGNVDCDGAISSVDALKVLRHSAALPVVQSEPCLDLGLYRFLPPPDNWAMGDINCAGGVNSVDALFILRANAGLPVSLPAECPPIKP